MVRWGGGTSKRTAPPPLQRVAQALGGSAPPPSAGGVCSWGVETPSPRRCCHFLCWGVRSPSPPLPSWRLALVPQAKEHEVEDFSYTKYSISNYCPVELVCKYIAAAESSPALSPTPGPCTWSRVLCMTVHHCRSRSHGITMVSHLRGTAILSQITHTIVPIHTPSNCKSPTSWTFSVMSDWLSAETQAVAFSAG